MMSVQLSSVVFCTVVLVSISVLVVETRHAGHEGRYQSGDASSSSRSRYAPQSNCSRCSGAEINRDDKRNYRIESIKADILRKLHLRSPPNVTGRQLPALPHIQEWIEKLSVHQNDGEYRMDYDPEGSYSSSSSGGDEEDDERATTMKVFQFSKPLPADRQIDPLVAKYTCYFPFPTAEVHHADQIVNVTLGVYVRLVPPEASSVLIVSVPVPGGSPRTIASKRIYHGNSGKWHLFRLSHFSQAHFRHWLSQPSSNYGLIIQSSVSHGGELAVVTPRNAEEESYKPFLEIKTREIANSRRRRSTDMNCDERSTERLCCRYPLEVDFASFGWDWIIVPTRFSAYYCSGECPYLFMQQHGNSQFSHMVRPQGAGGACCSPRKASPISMLYYDQNMNIVYGKLPNMVVDRCGCS